MDMTLVLGSSWWPGLGLCLEVGVRKALKIAAEYRLPVIRIHHMEAHATVAKLPKPSANLISTSNSTSTSSTECSAQDQNAESNLSFPFLTVLVSGGHNASSISSSVFEWTGSQQTVKTITAS